MNTEVDVDINGKWWLHELKYGTEKHLQGDRGKLEVTKFELRRLLSTYVIIETLGESEQSEIIEGKVRRFVLSKGTITIAQNDSTERTVPYCEIKQGEQDHYAKRLPEYPQVIPTVTMLAEQEYKF